jgi:hypothetical protein
MTENEFEREQLARLLHEGWQLAKPTFQFELAAEKAQKLRTTIATLADARRSSGYIATEWHMRSERPGPWVGQVLS